MDDPLSDALEGLTDEQRARVRKNIQPFDDRERERLREWHDRHRERQREALDELQNEREWLDELQKRYGPPEGGRGDPSGVREPRHPRNPSRGPGNALEPPSV